MINKELIINSFSVIVPLYNKVEYIERAINSILNQTYQNFELIIVNDGSIDGGEKKIELNKDSRIQLITQSNQGVSVARNTGAKNAKYNYLAFLDADDIWDENFLEEINFLINEYPNAGIFATNNYFEYPNGKVLYQNYDWIFGGKKSGIISDYFKIFAKIGKSPFSNSNICIPQNIFESIGGYKAGVKSTEDSDLWCRIALKNNIAYLTTPLATYFIDLPNNTQLLIQREDYQVSVTLQNSLDDNQVKPEHIKSVRKLIAFQQLSLVKRAILTGNKAIALDKLFDMRIFRKYRVCFFSHLLFALLPFNVFNKFKKLFK